MHLLTKSTNWIQEFLYRTPRLVPCGTNWKQEFCYRGPPRAKCHSVSERRVPPPPGQTYILSKYICKYPDTSLIVAARLMGHFRAGNFFI